MIKNIIFDFGDVFINLDKTAIKRELNSLGTIQWNEELESTLHKYETGLIETSDFIAYFKNILHVPSESIINAWNAILKDFPIRRLNFIKKLATQKKYKLILLSNTNELHINWIKEHILFYEEFKSCFDAFYLSHEINLRKPNADIFQFVINTNHLTPSETLFIDDTSENTIAAALLDIKVWNNNPENEDIVDLFSIKSDLF